MRALNEKKKKKHKNEYAVKNNSDFCGINLWHFVWLWLL